MDRNGNLFFVTMDPIALICWDSSLPYTRDNLKIVVQNDITLQFASGLKVIKNLDGYDEVWILTNRFQVWIRQVSLRFSRVFNPFHVFLWQKIMTESISANEFNFRIQVRSVNQLLNGKMKCNGRQLNANFIFPQWWFSYLKHILQKKLSLNLIKQNFK